MAIDPEYDFYNFRAEPHLESNDYSVSIEIRDGWGGFIGEVADYSELQYSHASDVSDLEASSFTVAGSSKWAKALMRANRSIVLVHFVLRRGDEIVKVWTGRIERSVRSLEGPQGSISVECVSDKVWIFYMIAQNSAFTELWLQQKLDMKVGQAVTIMKEFLATNLTRIAYQSQGRIIGNIEAWQKSNFLNDETKWRDLQTWMWPLTVVPSKKADDRSPKVVLTSRMTRMTELFHEVAKDYNLLVKVHFHVPGRDQAPANLPMPRAGLWVDVIDKDKARSRGEKPEFFGQFVEDISVFVRGLFGRYDEPRFYESTDIEDLKDWFGRREDDPWVIFRYSKEHFSDIEISSYAPTFSRSLAGGNSPEALNQGIQLLVNTALKIVFSQVGILLPDILDGELDDILFAHRDFQDSGMREMLGPFTLYEEYSSSQVTAWGTEAAQALRSSRRSAQGYKTATFSATGASFPPFRPFEDFDLLDQVGYEDPDEDLVQLERVKLITIKADRYGIGFDMSLGEAERPEDPISVQQRRIEMLNSALNALANS